MNKQTEPHPSYLVKSRAKSSSHRSLMLATTLILYLSAWLLLWYNPDMMTFALAAKILGTLTLVEYLIMRFAQDNEHQSKANWQWF